MLQITPEKLREIKFTLPTGTTVFVCNPEPLECKIIRKVINSVYDHTVLVIWVNGYPRIAEATWGKVIADYDFDEWINGRLDNQFGISIPDCVIKPEAITKHYGKRYDGISVCAWFPIYRSTGIWLGRTGDKASEKLFCFEFTALARGIGGKWWRIVPPDFPEYGLK